MGKHRFRNRIKSMVGSLIDTDKDEELKESNIETEENYKEIIELLNEDDQQDKEKLVGLIEKFHNRYQSLYWRYDNITDKLKEKVRSKKEKEKDSSSSSSSDSDSDGSSNKNGSKNGKMENQIDTVTDSLKEEVEAANIEIDELKRKLAVETEEKIVLKSQVIETEEMFNELKLQSDGLHEENSKLLAENRNLNSKLENFLVAETEMKQKIEDINRENAGLVLEREAGMKTIEELKAVIDELRGENKDFESELVDVKCEFSEMKNKLQTTEEEMLVLIQKLENVELENKSLFVECSQLREKLFEKENELSMQAEMHELFKNETESKIEKMSDEKEQIVDQLEESIEDLKSDLEMKGDEINTLTETVRNLEVKIRLANQKLRVTEQMLNETEHDHATKEEKLHQENNILMDKISTMSQTITTIKKDVKEKVNETLTGIDSLNVKFEEDYGHVTTRVYEITNEIHATQNRFKQKTEEMTMKLKVSAEENASLVNSLENMKIGIAKKDEKIDELNNTILMKEEWISSFGEDKREAIKQLCIWADYHRDRYDHLHELLLKKTAGSRRRTVS